MNPGMHPSTKEELLVAGTTIQDDVSFYAFEHVATNEGGGATFDTDYIQYCEDTLGYVPIRVHNVDPNNNPFNKPVGNPCCMGLTLPPDLKEYQKLLINECVPLTKVVIDIPNALASLGAKMEIIYSE